MAQVYEQSQVKAPTTESLQRYKGVEAQFVWNKEDSHMYVMSGTAGMNTKLANSGDSYLKSETYQKSEVYTKAEVDDMVTGGEVDLDAYLQKTEAESTYLKKTDAGTTYATKTEVTEGLADKLGKQEKAQSATTADTATKATQDGDGSVIKDTYVKKTVNNGINWIDARATDKKGTFGVGVDKSELKQETTNDGQTTFKSSVETHVDGSVYLKGAKVYVGTQGDGSDKKDLLTEFSLKSEVTEGLNGKLGKTDKAKSAETADSATKATQDGNGKVIADTYATKEELGNKADKTALNSYLQKSEAENIYAKKTDISSVFKFKGEKENQAALPSEGNTTGDVWHVKDTQKEFVWDGTKWEELGVSIDLSGYATKSELTSGLESKLGKTEKAASATIADTATKATQDSEGRVIKDTYLTSASKITAEQLPTSIDFGTLE